MPVLEHLPPTSPSSVLPSSAFDQHILNRLRWANIRLRLALNRIEFAKTSLDQGWVDGETALALIAEAGPGLLRFVTKESTS